MDLTDGTVIQETPVLMVHRVFLEVLAVQAHVEPREMQDSMDQMVHLEIKAQRAEWGHQEIGGTRVCRERRVNPEWVDEWVLLEKMVMMVQRAVQDLLVLKGQTESQDYRVTKDLLVQ
jgi:hypothetical protein